VRIQSASTIGGHDVRTAGSGAYGISWRFAALGTVLALSAGCGNGGASAGTSALAEGRVLYEANCMSCHGPTAQGDGPDAGSLPVRPATLTEHLGHHTQAQFIQLVRGGVPPAMPPADLSEDQVRLVVDYLWTLVPEEQVEALRAMQHQTETGGDAGMAGMDHSAHTAGDSSSMPGMSEADHAQMMQGMSATEQAQHNQMMQSLSADDHMRMMQMMMAMPEADRMEHMRMMMALPEAERMQHMQQMIQKAPAGSDMSGMDHSQHMMPATPEAAAGH
jgi:mono/diheme cytochrome c family protein